MCSGYESRPSGVTKGARVRVRVLGCGCVRECLPVYTW